jgi:hypothetical protein
MDDMARGLDDDNQPQPQPTMLQRDAMATTTDEDGGQRHDHNDTRLMPRDHNDKVTSRSARGNQMTKDDIVVVRCRFYYYYMTVSTPPFIPTNFANSEHATTRHHTQQHGHDHNHHHEVGTRPLREWPPNGEQRHLSPFVIVFYSVRMGPCPLFLSTNNFRCHVAVGDVGTIRRTTTDVFIHRHFLFYVYLCMYSSFFIVLVIYHNSLFM